MTAFFLFISYSVFWTSLSVGFFLIAFFGYASFNISFGLYLKAFCRKQTNEKIVSLTFDDGPHPENTLRVLDVLKKYNIKATFFVIGSQIVGNEDVLKRTVLEGHHVGNHSFSHKNTFPFFSTQKMVDDILYCEQAIFRSIGCKTKWFRPPFGVTNPNVSKAVKRTGYKVAGWSIRSLDTVKSDKDAVARRVVSKLHPGAVILLHDNLRDTPYILEEIIINALKQGYGFEIVVG